MKCKKCKKDIPDYSVFCLWCGAAQKKDRKKKMYQRPDGLFEKIIVLNGKRVPFRGKTESEVYKKIAAYEEKQEAGRTFREVAEEWWEIHSETLSPNSLSGYRPAKRAAVDYFDDAPIGSINAKQVQAFIDSIVAKGYASKTVKTYLSIVSMAFRYAVTHGEIEHSPCDYTRVPAGLLRTRRDPPSESEIKVIQANCNSEFGLFAFFLLYTGCRLGEALAITGADINKNDLTISIKKSVYFDGVIPKIKLPKTKSGIREIPIPDILAEKIPPLKKDEYLFGNPTKSQYERLWKRYRKNTGLNLTPHQLRHGYATLLYEAGVDVKEAQYLLGHSDMSTTMNIYTHLSKSKKVQTFSKFNDFTKNTQ